MFADFDEHEFEEIVGCFKPKSVTKNGILLHEGNICKEFYFIQSGCLRTYFIDKNGSEKTRYVMLDNHIGTALTSFLSQKRSFEFIEALEKIESTTITDADKDKWKNQMATARFFRGLFHFYLHSDFNNGNVIIRNETPKNTDDINKGLSTSDEVLNFFRSDLKYAYANLPAKYPVANENLGKVTAGSAATILGTSYLYQNHIDSATTVFKDLVENTAYGYALETDITKLFTSAGEFNKESILISTMELVITL